MSNCKINPPDPLNITEKERTRLINRDKCRKYRAKHKDHIIQYQREYKQKHKFSPTVRFHYLKNRLVSLLKTIEKHSKLHNHNSRYFVTRAVARMEEIYNEIIKINYTETNAATDTRLLLDTARSHL